jgi:hypothetical protein
MLRILGQNRGFLNLPLLALPRKTRGCRHLLLRFLHRFFGRLGRRRREVRNATGQPCGEDYLEMTRYAKPIGKQ